MVKSRVMGPSWLALKGANRVASASQASWCKLEVNVAGAHKAVRAPRGDAVDAVYTTAKRTMRVTEASMTLAQKRGAAAKK